MIFQKKEKPRTKCIDPDYRVDPKADLWCIRCQKTIRGAHRLIYITVDGHVAVHPDDVSAHASATDIGWQPIGNDCARIVGVSWTVPPPKPRAKPKLRLPRPSPGYSRKFLRCKSRGCKRVFYYDYVPYSLSNPIYVQPCGHNVGSREKIFGEQISEAEFRAAFAEELAKRKVQPARATATEKVRRR